jgi:hypothetical protein
VGSGVHAAPKAARVTMVMAFPKSLSLMGCIIYQLARITRSPNYPVSGVILSFPIHFRRTSRATTKLYKRL